MRDICINTMRMSDQLYIYLRHSLRHTFCARFCENETNLKVIQSVMGHIDIGTTMNIYAEVSEAKKKQSMEALATKLDLF